MSKTTTGAEPLTFSHVVHVGSDGVPWGLDHSKGCTPSDCPYPAETVNEKVAEEGLNAGSYKVASSEGAWSFEYVEIDDPYDDVEGEGALPPEELPDVYSILAPGVEEALAEAAPEPFYGDQEPPEGYEGS